MSPIFGDPQVPRVSFFGGHDAREPTSGDSQEVAGWNKHWMFILHDSPRFSDQTFGFLGCHWLKYGYGSIPIHTIFSGMNIHLPAILGFTRYQGFDPSPYIKITWGSPHPTDSPRKRRPSPKDWGLGQGASGAMLIVGSMFTLRPYPLVI